MSRSLGVRRRLLRARAPAARLTAVLLLAGAAALGLALWPLPVTGSLAAQSGIAAARPLAWRAAWFALLPGLAAMAVALVAWTAEVAARRWIAAAAVVAAAAFGADVVAIVLIGQAPELGSPRLAAGMRWSAGAATLLWTTALALALRHSRLDPQTTRLARVVVASQAALVASAAASWLWPAGWVAAASLLSAGVFVLTPALFWRLASHGPRPRGDATRPPGRARASTRLLNGGPRARVHDYRLVTIWSLDARAGEVTAVFHDTESLGRWWRAAFLDVALVRPGDAQGIGRTVRLHTKGWLPYTLHLEAEVVSCAPASGFVVRTSGDFEGRCECRLAQQGSRLRVDFDWIVRVHAPFVRRLSWLLKPLFAWNHGWVMRQGLRGMEAELDRRRRLAGRPVVPREPPRPTFPYDARTRAVAAWLARIRVRPAPARAVLAIASTRIARPREPLTGLAPAGPRPSPPARPS